MSEPDRTEGPASAPDGTTPAQKYLQQEFSRCSAMLVSFESGAQAMQEGHGSFDTLWSETVRNAGRLFGRTSTREALERMGRPEDTKYLY